MEKGNNKIIVHTEENRENLQKLKRNCNVEVVDYPMSINNNCLNKSKSNYEDENKKMIKALYYGGTRFDKGVDILLEALKYTKENIELIIAGKEEQFSNEFIEEKVQFLTQHKFILDINFISDEKSEEYFNKSDIIILPYRKHFRGESGVFIQALTYGRPVIVPNIIHFKKVLSKYKNGITFECENPHDLAKKIDFIVNNIDEFKVRAKNCCNYYRELYSVDRFIDSYKVIIEGN